MRRTEGNDVRHRDLALGYCWPSDQTSERGSPASRELGTMDGRNRRKRNSGEEGPAVWGSHSHQIHTDKAHGWLPGTEGWEKTESALNRYKVSAREEGKLLEMEHNSENYLMHRTVHLKMVKMVKLGFGYFIVILKTVMKRQFTKKVNKYSKKNFKLTDNLRNAK